MKTIRVPGIIIEGLKFITIPSFGELLSTLYSSKYRLDSDARLNENFNT